MLITWITTHLPTHEGWMAELAMLADSGRLIHKVVTHPASSLAQDRESSLAETSVLTTMLLRQRDDGYNVSTDRSVETPGSQSVRYVRVCRCVPADC